MKIESIDDARILDRPAGFRELLAFCQQVEAGKTPSRETLEQLARGFRRLLKAPNTEKGLDAMAKELRLIGPRRTGRPEIERIAGRNWSRAVQVYLKVLNGGIDEKTAVREVANETGCTEKTVERALKDYPDARSFAQYVIAVKNERKRT